MNAKDIVSQMTLEQKAFFVSGKTFWRTQPLNQRDIPSMLLIDGPHGLRKQVEKSDHLGLNEAQNAICFPPACALASSFDVEVLEKVGSYIGEQAQVENVALVLGPGNNIKRSPLCGRNFEYFSEDPFLSGKLAAAHIRGLQKFAVGCSLKHFVANNQERWRNTVNAVIDERTLREIYLHSFEIPVRESKPATVMCSYNMVNGTYVAENHYLLSEVLRDEWGFEGFVVSDWGAVDELQNSIAAGLDLEMPTSGKVGPQKIIRAVKKGRLAPEKLDRAVERILSVFISILEKRRNAPKGGYDKEHHHHLAYEIAKECIVLLKNRDGILPLDPSQKKKIALIGDFAKTPRFQGGGSSHINPYKVENLLECMTQAAASCEIAFARGYSATKNDGSAQDLIRQACELAGLSDVVIVNAGLTDDFETEGGDRVHLNMPPDQLSLIDALCAVNENIVVVLSNGSAVKMPFEPRVKAIVEGYLLGQSGAKAMADILFGLHNPSGKLAESFIRKEEDDPAYGNMPGDGMEAVYREGIFIGYRYHEKMKTDLLYPFGHGLSYTEFEYEPIVCAKTAWSADETITLHIAVKNTGSRAGKEAVQLYVGEKTPCVERPLKELKGFEKVHIEPGQSKTLTFELNFRSFAYYHVQAKTWTVRSGDFEILVGSSSADIRQRMTLTILSSGNLQAPDPTPVYRNKAETDRSGRITRNTRVEQIETHPTGKFIYRSAMKHVQMMFGGASFAKESEKNSGGNSENSGVSDFKMSTIKTMVLESPLRNMVNMSAGTQMKEHDLKFLISFLNASGSKTLLGKLISLFLK